MHMYRVTDQWSRLVEFVLKLLKDDNAYGAGNVLNDILLINDLYYIPETRKWHFESNYHLFHYVLPLN